MKVSLILLLSENFSYPTGPPFLFTFSFSSFSPSSSSTEQQKEKNIFFIRHFQMWLVPHFRGLILGLIALAYLLRYANLMPMLMFMFTLMSLCKPALSKDDGNSNENATKQSVLWAKTITLHALHVRFTCWYISVLSSAKQQREVIKISCLWRTPVHENKHFILSPNFSTV